MKKALFILLTVLLVIGCSSRHKVVELTFFTYNTRFNEVLQRSIDEFTSKHKNKYLITIETIQYEPHLVLQNRLDENTAWDIMMMPPYDSIKNNAEKGYLLDITETGLTDQIYPSLLNAVTYNERLFGLPYGVDVFGVYYNKDIFNAYGLKPPKTLIELQEIIRVLNSRGITPFSISGKEEGSAGDIFYMFMTGVMNNNYSIWAESMSLGLSSYNNPAVDTVFEMLDIYRGSGGRGFSDIDFQGHITRFSNGDAAMIVLDNSSLRVIQRTNPDFKMGFFPFPIVNADTQTANIDTRFAFCISSRIDHEKQEAAELFLKYLTEKNVAGSWNSATGAIIAVRDCNRSLLSTDIVPFLNADSIVNKGQYLIPRGVYEETKTAVNSYLNGRVNKSAVVTKLDTVYGTIRNRSQ